MKSLFTKQVSVEEIHAEFDTAEQRIIEKCNQLLSECKIPSETKLESKAKMLQELGFVNAEPVKQAKTLFDRREELHKFSEITKNELDSILYLKGKYPFSKFITISELERICNKYGLIHAPVTNYIKDIPEKNVLEMKNSIKLDVDDLHMGEYRISFNDRYTEDLKKLMKYFNKTEPIFTNKEVRDNHIKFRGYCPDNWLFEESSQYMVFHNLSKILNISIMIKTVTKIDKSGLFIAAPKSHFNLSGLDKQSKFGFFKTVTMEVEDPVVFEYCNNDICRIITKWGTDDDQSYLDEALTNENLN